MTVRQISTLLLGKMEKKSYGQNLGRLRQCGRGVVYDRATRKHDVAAYGIEQAGQKKWLNITYPSAIAVVYF